jgi:hypothetical protein
MSGFFRSDPIEDVGRPAVIAMVAGLSQFVSVGAPRGVSQKSPVTADAAPAADVQPKAKMFISFRARTWPLRICWKLP